MFSGQMDVLSKKLNTQDYKALEKNLTDLGSIEMNKAEKKLKRL